MTLKEINKKAYKKYPVKMVPDDDTMGFTESDVNERSRVGYIEAYKEISALPTVKGWVMRGSDGILYLSREYPIDGADDAIPLPPTMFTSLRRTSDPIEVELPIIIKKEK